MKFNRKVFKGVIASMLLLSGLNATAQSGNGYIMTSMDFSKINYPSNTIDPVQSQNYYPVSIDFINDTIYGAFADINNGDFIGKIDQLTGTVTSMGLVNIPGYTINGLCDDPTNGVAYALASQGFGSTSLFVFDLTTLTGTFVGIIGSDLYVAMEFDDLGNLYAINYADNGFYSIDKTTAVPTLIGSIGLPIGGPHVDLGFNSENGTMYAGLFDPGFMNVCTVNLSTGAATSQVATTDANVLTICFGGQTCNATTNSLTITSCNSYSVPSGDETYNSTGVYYDTIPNAAGCDSILTLDLTINPIPGNNVTQLGSLLSADETGALYQWLDCDDNYALISGETGQSYTPTVSGNYAVAVTLNGCADTSACYLVDNIGISELYQGIISIYPNPASEVIIISGIKEILGLSHMEIVSTTGKLVSTIENNKVELNISELRNGMYFLNIYHQGGKETIRFVKQ